MITADEESNKVVSTTPTKMLRHIWSKRAESACFWCRRFYKLRSATEDAQDTAAEQPAEVCASRACGGASISLAAPSGPVCMSAEPLK